jgi:hypothetical protein
VSFALDDALAGLTRVMAKRDRDEVGPWREYLPVLTRGGPTG